ncbi:hypothetical protein D5282_24870 [bacterium 1xD8-48]|nr:hypothetical protein [bacterium 1xD8-48]
MQHERRKSMSKKETSGLTIKHKVGYGLGDAGGCMTFALMTGMFTRYCMNVLQVDSRVLAGLLFVWNVWDAVNDPMMGAFMDKVYAKSHNKKGKFRPWLLRATPMLAVTAIALWTVPTFFSGVAMIAALFICKILYEGCYTMFNIPMGSLLSAMANTDEERAGLSSARGFGSIIGNLIPMVLFPLLLAQFGDSATGFGLGATVCALVGGVMCFLHYYWTEERNISDAPKSDDNAEKVKITDILNVVRVNRAFLALCIHGICICVMQNASSSLGTYMYKDVMGNIGMMSMASTIAMPLSIVFLAIAPKVAKKLGLVKMIRHGLLFSCVMYVALFALHMVMNVNIWVHIIWSSLASGFASLSVLMQWGMVGEAIDYNEYLTGKRTEGSIYGSFNLARRIGNTVGSSLAVLMLGWVGYDTAAAVQSAAAITGIKALCVLMPGIFVIGSWLAFTFVWNITPEIREKMAQSKGGQSA